MNKTQNTGDISTLLQWFDNDFAIKSKYHHVCVLFIYITQILSLQDDDIRSLFCLIFANKLVLKEVALLFSKQCNLKQQTISCLMLQGVVGFLYRVAYSTRVIITHNFD